MFETFRAGFAIEKIVAPAAPAFIGQFAPNIVADFCASVELSNALTIEILGTAAMTLTAQELLPGRPNPFEPKWGFVAKVQDKIVGRGAPERPQDAIEFWTQRCGRIQDLPRIPPAQPRCCT